jgi:hypothetical protein
VQEEGRMEGKDGRKEGRKEGVFHLHDVGLKHFIPGTTDGRYNGYILQWTEDTTDGR